MTQMSQMLQIVWSAQFSRGMCTYYPYILCPVVHSTYWYWYTIQSTVRTPCKIIFLIYLYFYVLKFILLNRYSLVENYELYRTYYIVIHTYVHTSIIGIHLMFRLKSTRTSYLLDSISPIQICIELQIIDSEIKQVPKSLTKNIKI